MALNQSDLLDWRDHVDGLLAAASAQVAAEVARDVGTDPQELRLHNGLIGHLRTRVITLTAQRRWLDGAATTVGAGGTHPAQALVPPVLAADKTIPPKPPAWASG
jgi:hypothetical protein